MRALGMQLASAPVEETKEATMLKKLLFVSMIGLTVATQFGCAPLAAGVAGAAIGHEIGEEEHDGD
jgi:hypothetical protein